MAYAVFRSDRMTGTKDPAHLVSVMYYDQDQPAEIENGTIVCINDQLVEGEREIFKATAPKTDTPADQLAIIGSEELMYDERKKNLDEFINEAGKPARAYLPVKNNIYSATIDAFECDEPAQIKVGDTVEIQDSKVKPKITSSPSGATVIGKIVDINKTARYTYYAVLLKI